ncbi:MAG: YCF48-related protein [Bacteroidota bacterium]
MHYSIARLLVTFLVSGCILEAIAQPSWRRLASPTAASLHHLSFTDSLIGWAAGDSGVILRTTTGGEQWIIQPTGVSTEIVDLFFLNRNLGWALTWNQELPPYGTTVLKTTNGGATWVARSYPQQDVFIKSIHFLDSSRGFAGGYPRILVRTTDGGDSWFQAQVIPEPCSALPVIDFDFTSDRHGCASGGLIDIAGPIWKTTDYGQTWSVFCISSEPVERIIMFDSLNIIGIGGDFEHGSSVVRTTNGGENWTYTAVIPLGVAHALSFRTRSEGWSSVALVRQFLFTSDGGENWITLPTPENAQINDLVFTDSLHGYAVGMGGVIFKYVPRLVNVKENDLPTSVQLFQNYPNPFNPTTTIAFTLPFLSEDYDKGRGRVGSHVTLKVYDQLGREVGTLVNEEKPPGTYSATWDASNVASGVYFYRLQTRGVVQSKMLLLLR